MKMNGAEGEIFGNQFRLYPIAPGNQRKSRSSQLHTHLQAMESDLSRQHHLEDEEEYVVLDLDAVSRQVDIPPNAPYVLTGLDTLNPILIIDDKLKLIGEYEETIGTCLVFSESEAPPVGHEETGPSEENLFSGKFIIDPNQAPRKQVSPIASLHKILKFRWLMGDDDEKENATANDSGPVLDQNSSGLRPVQVYVRKRKQNNN